MTARPPCIGTVPAGYGYRYGRLVSAEWAWTMRPGPLPGEWTYGPELVGPARGW